MSEPLIEAEAVFEGLTDTMVKFGVITGRDLGSVIEQQFKLFTRDGMKDTAPFETWGAFGESWGEQRQVGMAAVTRDIQKVFEPFEELGLVKTMSNPGLKTRIHNYAMAGDVAALQALSLKIMPRLQTENIVYEPRPVDHFTQRDRRGRVRRHARRFFVARAKSLKDYIKVRTGWVGWLKSGLGAAAVRLGVSAPEWVLRGGTNGTVTVSLTLNNPYISATNTIPYAGVARVEEGYALALGQRKTAMIRQIQAKMAGAWGRAGGGREAA